MSSSTSDSLGGGSSRTERSKGLQADGALMFITCIWGVTFVVVKDALGYADPFTFLAMRFGVGALALSVLAGRQVFSPTNLRHGALLAMFLFLGFALQTWGLTLTTPSRSAFITGMSVLFVPLLSLVVFRRMPKPAALVGVGLSAAGLYLLTRPQSGAGGAWLSAGELLSLGCAVAYAGHITLTERYASKEGVLGMVAVQLWGVALLSAACLPFVARRVEWHPSLVTAVLVCGLLPSAFAISVQTWAQARTSAVRAAVIYALEPVFAAMYSVVLGYEVLGAPEAMGGGLILLGVLVAELGTSAWTWWRSRGPGVRRAS
ncbi:DMT family transporter [Myxococcus sp. K15C18031901]|uniref:DMT family transporter n=1 Tax=Myxococcus dinghuensis TaxID=2906761 RepID=UPI0020A72D12|nr:EamA family transporter [Myxococcus dinghuensis]MCP3101205.1 DMT family transporter [Myxococcus dinghuensis]